MKHLHILILLFLIAVCCNNNTRTKKQAIQDIYPTDESLIVLSSNQRHNIWIANINFGNNHDKIAFIKSTD